MAVFGLKVETPLETRERSVIGDIETSAAGNVVLRIGRENGALAGELTGWHQTEHVVLTREEAEQLVGKLGQAIYASNGGAS